MKDLKNSADWAGRIWILALYVTFAVAVCIAQGPRPPIGIDHIAYFKIADEIRASHPQHDYWRAITVTHSYGVIMAYFYELTGDHVRTLKIMLALTTIAYLWCAESFLGRFTTHRRVAVLFAMISAIHVSFGSVFWGVTDFAASLNRTLVLPPMLLLLGWYFSNYSRHRRMLVYPALIYLSVLHLGTYYLLGVLAVMDGLRLVHALRVRREAFGPALGAYIAAFALVGAAYVSIEPLNLKRRVLTQLIPRIEGTASINAGAASAAPTGQAYLSSRDAWAMEIFAQPWRNFPPPLATLLAAAMSLAFIVPLSFAGGYIAIRNTGWRPADGPMLLMACSVLICAYSLQCLLWIIRRWLAIYPINFEEVRTVSFVYLPILYFILRGFEWLWFGRPTPGSRRVAILGLLLLILQPIFIIRLLPRNAREHIITIARQTGILDQRESQRNMYARQTLGLEADRRRFYYSVLPLLSWLRTHTNRADRVLTNRDDLYLLNAKVVGTSNGFLDTDIRSPERLIWHGQVLELDAALAARDSQRVRRLARDSGADFAVVPWSEPGAIFDDGSYSIIATR